MAIDVYSLCPCQSGKKIKFCCGKDVVNELDQISSRIQSNQLPSALGLIDRTIDAKGKKDCLSVLKSSILISQQDLNAAQQANEEFLAEHAKHPIALQHAVQIAVRKGRFDQAVDLFQDAMEAIQEVIPPPTAGTTRDVAVALLQMGDVPAAMQHLKFADSLTAQDDDRIASLIMSVIGDAAVNQLLKLDLVPDPTSSIEAFEQQPWAKSYTNVHRLIERGQFRRALKLLQRIDEKFPDIGAVVRSIPGVMLSIGRREGLVEALERRARHEATSEHDAIVTMALSQLMNQSQTVDVLKLTYPVENFEKFSEMLTSHSRLATNPQPFSPEQFDGPPPRHSYLILDKNLPEKDDPLTVDNVASLVGMMNVFGRQTDREARVEVIICEEWLKTDVLDSLVASFGDLMSPESDREVAYPISLREFKSTFALHLDNELGFDKSVQIETEFRIQRLINDFATTEFESLGNQSIASIAEKNPADLLLRAALLQLEFELDQTPDARKVIQAVMSHYQIPAISGIEVKKGDPITTTLVRYVDLDSIPEDATTPFYFAASFCGDMVGAALLASHITATPPTEGEDLNVRYAMYRTLAHQSTTIEEGLESIQKAKLEFKAAGQPYGRVLVGEFEYCLGRGQTKSSW